MTMIRTLFVIAAVTVCFLGPYPGQQGAMQTATPTIER